MSGAFDGLTRSAAAGLELGEPGLDLGQFPEVLEALELGVEARRGELHLALREGVSAGSGSLYELGIRMGDGLRMAARTSGRRLPRARRISAAEALRWVPALDPNHLRGGLLRHGAHYAMRS